MGKETKTNQKEKANKGITLIALVITIIVLLILAAVSISTLTGENGILTKANEAKKQTEIANLIESVQTKILEEQATNESGKITKTKLKEILNNYFTDVPDNLEDMSDTDILDCTLTAKEEYGEYKIKLSEIWKGSFSQSSAGDKEPEETFTPITTNQEMFEFDPSTRTILRIKEQYMGKNIVDNYGQSTFFTYYISENYREINYLDGQGGCLLKNDIDEFIIPNMINGVEVKNVNYLGALNVKKLTFSEGIENIEGAYKMVAAGLNCDNNYSPQCFGIESKDFLLEEIKIPSTVKSIGDLAFYGCYGLKNVYFKNTEMLTFGGLCFGKQMNGDFWVGDSLNYGTYETTTYHFKNSTVANSFTTDYYDEDYGTKSTNYNW